MAVELYLMKPSAPCRAVWMALKAFNVDHEIKIVELPKGEHKTPEYTKMNPMQVVPTFKDGDYVLWESRAILVYIASKYGKDDHPLYPKDAQKRGKVNQMLSMDMGTIYRAVGEYMYPQLFRKEEPTDATREKIADALKKFQTVMGDSPYAAGDSLTIADLSILSTLVFLELKDYDFTAFPKVDAYIKKLKKELPYFKECHEGLYAFKAFISK